MGKFKTEPSPWLALVTYAVLAAAFIVIRLCGVVTWSWWIVTAPLWIPAAFCLLSLIVTAIYVAHDVAQNRRQSGYDKE